ncbi:MULTISPECIES: (d)CMP kinase [environmental samples]|uniref:(d)CMP kinase n=1 Tax=environmental samples TaxID=876090 RepID=UPI00033AEBBC|nr:MULTISPECIES: (d)CMP kinase [environmental samples]CDC74032.1 cytidylate kinase [Oscillibacter sp. CAG:155]
MNETHPISIAIDGPSGAGKSTLARQLASALHFLYVDTGAIYRTIAYYAYANHLDPSDEAAVLAALPDIRIELCHDTEGLQRMILNGEDVTDAIRLPQISQYASVVSAYPGVRAFLLEMQRDFARKGSVIMDGRDIGTVVLPHADVKIFLTASPEARARRRCLELEQRGTPEPFDQVLSEIQQRDWDDSHRETAPLRQAEDAVVVDTTELNFEESLAALLTVVRGKAAL